MAVRQNRLQSNGAMDYEDMIKTLKYLLDAAWGSDWGSFTPDGPNINDAKNIEYPIIIHYMTSMTPGLIGKDTREIKPRFRQSVLNENSNGDMPPITNIYGQVFDAEVVFEIWEETNAQVDKLTKQFRQTITAFTGYLKEKGLKEILFQKMEPNLESDKIRDSYKIRKLTYLVRFEELNEVPVDIFHAFDVVDKRLQEELGE
ncbi:hypothetical protein ACFX4N_23735 [Priestia sp. YIM B13551]|uniref:hypothetical protein n=1 Tax=Priestia sp. YIM B13551 TaxID=3366306 RepID=UPI0036714D71